MIRVVKHWHRLSGDMVDALSLETLKVSLDWTPSTWWSCRCPSSLFIARELEQMTFDDLFQLKPFYDSIKQPVNKRKFFMGSTLFHLFTDLYYITPFPLSFPHFPIQRSRVTLINIPTMKTIPLLVTFLSTLSSFTLSFPIMETQCYAMLMAHRDIFSNTVMLCCIFTHA